MKKSGMGWPGCADISAPTPQCIYANEINGVATCVEATSQKREVAHPQLFLITLKTTGVTLARETLATRQLAPITKSSNEFLYCFKSK
jgi:hypothetical protein